MAISTAINAIASRSDIGTVEAAEQLKRTLRQLHWSISIESGPKTHIFQGSVDTEASERAKN